MCLHPFDKFLMRRASNNWKRKIVNLLKLHLKNTVNVKNEDNYCVLYNIVLSVFGESILGNPEDPKNLEKYISYINRDGVNFPVEGPDLLTLEMNKIWDMQEEELSAAVAEFESNEAHEASQRGQSIIGCASSGRICSGRWDRQLCCMLAAVSASMR